MDILQSFLPKNKGKYLKALSDSLELDAIYHNPLNTLVYVEIEDCEYTSFDDLGVRNNNILYFIADRYEYFDISDYLMYLMLLVPNINQVKWLICLVYHGIDLNIHMPYIVYLEFDLYNEIGDWKSNYKNLQYLIIADCDIDYYTFEDRSRYLTLFKKHIDLDSKILSKYLHINICE
jgi:hypothetical protein